MSSETLLENNILYTDRSLFARIAEEDAGAYQAVFDLYYDRLRYNALKFLKSEFWAEEVAQEVFLQLWDERKKLPEVDNPAAWLYRIVSNRCLNLLRRQERELRAQYTIQLSAHSASSYQQSSYDLEVVRKLIKEAVDALPEQQRRVYQLRQEEGYSYKEIAALLEISPNTVHNHLARSVQSVRNYLLANGDFSFLLLFLLFY